MTLLVLAIDALDAGLVEHFERHEFELAASQEIETFAHAKDVPYTPEVWATVATGLGPDEHGVTGAGTSEWQNPLLEYATRLTQYLPEQRRGQLGRLARRTTGEQESVGHTDRETMFDAEGAVVRNWPGVTDGRDLQAAWDIMYGARQGMPRSAFERELLGLAAGQFGWAREMLNHDVSLAGVHVHALDAAGHVYNRDEDRLGAMYERVAEFVAELEAALGPDDDILLLSDHGMAAAFYGDDPDNSGNHSWRAFAASTTGDVPESVYAVRKWVERNASSVETGDDEDLEVPERHLRDLGYLE